MCVYRNLLGVSVTILGAFSIGEWHFPWIIRWCGKYPEVRGAHVSYIVDREASSLVDPKPRNICSMLLLEVIDIFLSYKSKNVMHWGTKLKPVPLFYSELWLFYADELCGVCWYNELLPVSINTDPWWCWLYWLNGSNGGERLDWLYWVCRLRWAINCND